MKPQAKRPAALNLRNMPRALVANLKAAAALHHQPLRTYLIELMEKHIDDVRRRGLLPKAK
jgi:hypothetical protein